MADQDIYVSPEIGGASVIRVGDDCYEYVEPSDEEPTVESIDGTFADCDTCASAPCACPYDDEHPGDIVCDIDYPTGGNPDTFDPTASTFGSEIPPVGVQPIVGVLQGTPPTTLDLCARTVTTTEPYGTDGLVNDDFIPNIPTVYPWGAYRPNYVFFHGLEALYLGGLGFQYCLFFTPGGSYAGAPNFVWWHGNLIATTYSYGGYAGGSGIWLMDHTIIDPACDCYWLLALDTPNYKWLGYKLTGLTERGVFQGFRDTSDGLNHFYPPTLEVV